MYYNGFLGWAQPDHCESGLFDPRILPTLRLLKFYHAVINAVEKSFPESGRNPYWFPANFKKFNPTRIRRSSNSFWIQDFYHYRSPNVSGPDPAIPHSIISMIDTSTDVPDDCILRSELLMGVLCMRHILTLRHWTGHYTLPFLILSYHGQQGRILQMHCENGQLHVRMSRHLDLRPRRYRLIPRDCLIMTKWFLSKPTGNTAFSSMPHQEGGDRPQHTRQDPGTSWPLEIPKEEQEVDALHDW